MRAKEIQGTRPERSGRTFHHTKVRAQSLRSGHPDLRMCSMARVSPGVPANWRPLSAGRSWTASVTCSGVSSSTQPSHAPRGRAATAFHIAPPAAPRPPAPAACALCLRSGSAPSPAYLQCTSSVPARSAAARASCIFNCAAAQRQHQRIFARQPRNRLPLALAERRLAMAREKVGDRHPGLGHDHVIRIHESPTQPLGQQRPHGALPRAHEAGKHNAAHRPARRPSFWFCSSMQFVPLRLAPPRLLAATG